MPHVTVEYSGNLRGAFDLPCLLARINETILALRSEDGPVFPIGGLRTRAIAYDDYRIADGGDHAFVHVTMRIGAGRGEEIERETAAAVFETVKTALAGVFDQRTLAISLVLERFSEVRSFKQNNIHAHFQRFSS